MAKNIKMLRVEIEIVTDASARDVHRVIKEMIDRADEFTAHSIRVVKAR